LQLDTTDDLEQMYGSLGYDFREQKPANILRKVFIIGYTLDNEVRLNQFSGDVLIEDRVLKHKMNTKPGCSGAPIVQLT
jgi:V8-like Glu-specific endopeptidase